MSSEKSAEERKAEALGSLIGAFFLIALWIAMALYATDATFYRAAIVWIVFEVNAIRRGA